MIKPLEKPQRKKRVMIGETHRVFFVSRYEFEKREALLLPSRRFTDARLDAYGVPNLAWGDSTIAVCPPSECMDKFSDEEVHAL